MRRILCSLVLVLGGVLAAQPIGLHPSNPHYYLFQGKPTVLITSAEHYGAVINRDFDYVAYFDALQSHGLNYTRIYPGYLIEPVDKFVPGNTLAPKAGGLIVPWARSEQPGYAGGGNKFDLDRWDPAFFARLRDFLRKAADRGIVVEICFFNAQYDDTWPLAPLCHKNNIQAQGHGDHNQAQTLREPELVRRESDYVRKITQEANSFDNVFLEICDEPIINGTPADQAGPWIAHMVAVIKETEAALPKKHLIAQQMEGPIGGPCDFTRHPDVPVIVAQYVWEVMGEQMGGMRALDVEYDKGKPIDLNETNYYPIWYEGDAIADSRAEAWEFLLGGGGSFNQLNGLYTVKNPRGDTAENARILGALTALKSFMEGLDFVAMHPDKSWVAKGFPEGVYCRGIAETGKQYALYHHHSTGGKGGSYKVIPGDYRETLTLRLPAGAYRAEWVEPATGRVLESRDLAHGGGEVELSTPRHAADLALRIRTAAQQRSDRLPNKVIVGTVTLFPPRLPKDLEARLGQLKQTVDRVAVQSRKKFGRDPDIVVLTEVAVTPEEPLPYSGQVQEVFSQAAREHHCYLVIPMMLRQDRQKFNVALLLDRKGEVAGIYRKVHLAVVNGSDSMENGATPGQSVPVFECDFGKLGIQICFDMEFDYGWQELERQGADLVVWPTASPQTAHPAARALKHGYYIVSSPWRHNASIFEPTGKIAAQIRPPESVLVEQIDLSYALVPWSGELRNGAALKARYGDKIGFRYYEEEDQGIFWSNDPQVSIGKMLREAGFGEAGAEHERILKLYREAGVPAYQ